MAHAPPSTPTTGPSGSPASSTPIAGARNAVAARAPAVAPRRLPSLLVTLFVAAGCLAAALPTQADAGNNDPSPPAPAGGAPGGHGGGNAFGRGRGTPVALQLHLAADGELVASPPNGSMPARESLGPAARWSQPNAQLVRNGDQLAIVIWTTAPQVLEGANVTVEVQARGGAWTGVATGQLAWASSGPLPGTTAFATALVASGVPHRATGLAIVVEGRVGGQHDVLYGSASTPSCVGVNMPGCAGVWAPVGRQRIAADPEPGTTPLFDELGNASAGQVCLRPRGPVRCERWQVHVDETKVDPQTGRIMIASNSIYTFDGFHSRALGATFALGVPYSGDEVQILRFNERTGALEDKVTVPFTGTTSWMGQAVPDEAGANITLAYTKAGGLGLVRIRVDGTELWNTTLPGVRGGVADAGDMLYVGDGMTGQLVAVEAATGKQTGRFTARDSQGRATWLTGFGWQGNDLFVAYETPWWMPAPEAVMTRLDGRTLAPTWDAPIAEYPWTLHADGQRIYLSNGNRVKAFLQSDGSPLWSHVLRDAWSLRISLDGSLEAIGSEWWTETIGTTSYVHIRYYRELRDPATGALGVRQDFGGQVLNGLGLSPDGKTLYTVGWIDRGAGNDKWATSLAESSSRIVARDVANWTVIGEAGYESGGAYPFGLVVASNDGAFVFASGNGHAHVTAYDRHPQPRIAGLSSVTVDCTVESSATCEPPIAVDPATSWTKSLGILGM